MIDIHNHILPLLDDGSQSLEESLLMARAAVAEGIHTIIATSHHANGNYDNEAKIIIAAVNELNQHLQTNQIPLTVRAGQEIRLYNNLIDDLHTDKLLTLNHSDYILIEFPSSRIPSTAKEIIHELTVMKRIPIIAHPERNQEIIKDPDKLTQLIEWGALSQITSSSINGLFGKKLQAFSLDLCRRDLVHFVASDAHNLTVRPFGLNTAYEHILHSLGEDYTHYYLSNARHIMDNTPIPVREPISRKKKWYKIWQPL